MAKIILTRAFSELSSWQGALFEAGAQATIDQKTSTRMAWTYGADHDFNGAHIVISGSGFAYQGARPVAGNMTKLEMLTDHNTPLLTISGIKADSFAASLSTLHAMVFGWTDPDGNFSGQQGKNAWSQVFSGNDTIIGTNGDDRNEFPGLNAGNDLFDMKGGDDFVVGSIGNDTIKGGNGFDTLSFENTHWNEGMAMLGGITVDVARGTVKDPYGDTDTVKSVEMFVGSVANDRFIGGKSDDNFNGLRGSDFFDGKGGEDWLSYSGDVWKGGKNGIVVNLETKFSGGHSKGVIIDGFGNTDRTIDIESVEGTRFSDKFIGSRANNTFVGGEGVDRFDGKGGVDTLEMRAWSDDRTVHGIKIDLSRSTGQIIDDGFGNSETALRIERIKGTDSNDVIALGRGDNWVDGRGGADTLTGGGGHDAFVWREESSLGARDVITDFHAGPGAQRDTLGFNVSAWGASTDLTLVKGTEATSDKDSFAFDKATHRLFFDADGTGGDGPVLVAVLNGVSSLSAANFELF